jgi:hypothetical protein
VGLIVIIALSLLFQVHLNCWSLLKTLLQTGAQGSVIIYKKESRKNTFPYAKSAYKEMKA